MRFGGWVTRGDDSVGRPLTSDTPDVPAPEAPAIVGALGEVVRCGSTGGVHDARLGIANDAIASSSSIPRAKLALGFLRDAGDDGAELSVMVLLEGNEHASPRRCTQGKLQETGAIVQSA